MVTANFNHSLKRSLIAHTALMALLIAWAWFAPHPKLFNSELTTIEILEPTKHAESESEHRQNKVVQRSEGKVTQNAAKNAFLSDETRTVEEEKSAKNLGELIPKAVQAGAEYRNHTKTPKLSDLGLKIDKSKTKESFEKERKWADPSTGEKIRGGQYIQGIKEGEVSALNTKEFVFYSYFERVRKQLDSSWQPLLRSQIEKIYKHGRRLASDSDYVTRTLVTLDQSGQVKRVQLLEQSGTVDLDQVAIDALNKAGPYPNPPKGLRESDGSIQIRWDFILKT